MNKQLIQEILLLAGDYCGGDFIARLSALRSERERILHNMWREEYFPEPLPHHQQDSFLRDIDFDTTIHHARRCIDDQQYIAFLYRVAELAVIYGELNRAEIFLKQIVEQYINQVPKDLLLKVHHKLSNILFIKNDYVMAELEYSKSLSLARELGDKKAVAMLTNVHGILRVNRNEIEQGIKLFQETIGLARAAQDDELLANTNMNLGNAFHVLGDYDQAMFHYFEALGLLKKYNQVEYLGLVNLNLAIAYKFKKEIQQARQHLDKTYELAKESNNRYQKSLAYLVDAELHLLDNDTSSAIAYVTSAFTIFSEMGDRLSVAEAYKILGLINQHNREFEIALSYFENSRRINEELGNYPNLAETLVETGNLYVKMNDTENARKQYQSALDYFKKFGATSKIKNVQLTLGQL